MTVSVVEKNAVLRAVAAGERPDGRTADAFRPVVFDFSTGKRGSLFLQLGHTKVQVTVSAELDRPFPDRPFEGQLAFYVEYAQSALSLDGFSPVGTRMDEEQFGGGMQRMLERVFKTGRAVDLESLCVVTGQRVWNIRVDVHVVDDDGNVLDAVVMAVMAALIDFRRPDVQVSAEGEVTVFSAFERHLVPLALHHFPLSVSFALIPIGDAGRAFLADPTSLEAVVQDATITLVLNRQGEIVHMCKPGGAPMPVALLLEQLLPVANTLAAALSDRVNEAVVSRPVMRM